MVRNIVGLLVSIGLGKLPPSEMERILLLQNRSKLPMQNQIAPPHGLYLVNVDY